MGLDERLHLRISKWEREAIDKYRIDASKICRDAIRKKIREFVTDPDLIIDQGGNGPAAIYVNAWQRVMPGITSILTNEDYKQLRDSQEKLEVLKEILDWPLLKPIEIQQMGLFMQGGDISERILMACIEAHL